MRQAGATVGPVYDIADAVADPHFREREIIVEVEDAELGQLPMHISIPASRRRRRLAETGTLLGEHTDAVLAEAGSTATPLRGSDAKEPWRDPLTALCPGKLGAVCRESA